LDGDEVGVEGAPTVRRGGLEMAFSIKAFYSYLPYLSFRKLSGLIDFTLRGNIWLEDSYSRWFSGNSKFLMTVRPNFLTTKNPN